MEEVILEYIPVSHEVFNYLILPLLIFCARIIDVSISTIRIIMVMSGKRTIAPILGFFEALVWLLAMGQIISNVDNAWSYFAYALGFATGTYVGMYIEEKLAIGKVVLRLITKEPVEDLKKYLQKHDYRYSILDAQGKMGPVHVVFLVIKRERLMHLTSGINKLHPKAFYTIEGVKQVNETDLRARVAPSIGFRWKQLFRR